MAEDKQENLVVLKRAVSAMRPRIDRLLSGGEKRELLKLISRGMIKNVNDLRAYLGRVEQMKSKQQKEQTCQLCGKVIDADNRRPLGRVRIKIQHTTFDEETDTNGNFIWEGCIKGRQYVIDVNCRSYRPTSLQYKATMDEEQFVTIKMPPVNRGPRGKQKGQKGKGKVQ